MIKLSLGTIQNSSDFNRFLLELVTVFTNLKTKIGRIIFLLENLEQLIHQKNEFETREPLNQEIQC